MPYTFAEAGADDITFGTTIAAFNTIRACMVSGWFYKTGAGDSTMWSFGTVGNRLDWTATGELRLTTDRVTTDGVYTTSGLALANDQWYFICLFGNTLAGSPFEGTVLWVGTIESPPAEVAFTTTTAPVGSTTGSATFYIGNFGTSATDSFGGDIAHVTVQVTDVGGVGGFGVAAWGATTAAEAQWIYGVKVLPLWKGEVSTVLFQGAANLSAWHLALDGATMAIGFNRSTLAWQTNVATANGVVFSERRSPRPHVGPPFGQPILRRR